MFTYNLGKLVTDFQWQVQNLLADGYRTLKIPQMNYQKNTFDFDGGFGNLMFSLLVLQSPPVAAFLIKEDSSVFVWLVNESGDVCGSLILRKTENQV